MARTDNQVAFDLAMHGWAFANADGLARRVSECETIAERLSVYDVRHSALRLMKKTLRRLEREIANG
jgi:hypothetical protein